MNVRTGMLSINLHISMTVKILDPVVISAHVPNRTAKREPFVVEPCSV